MLHGKNFGDYQNITIVFISSADQENTYTVSASQLSTNETLIAALDPEMELGNYAVKIIKGSQYVILEDEFTLLPPRPEITSVSPTTLERGQTITITGEHFMASGNEVYLKLDNTYTKLIIVSESETEIVAETSDSMSPNEYSLSVETADDVAYFDQNITITIPSTDPVITEITDTSIAKGETMVIKGRNLKKAGAATNINFIPWPNGGTTQVRSGTPNDDGTEVTLVIPNSLPAGTYSVLVEVDLEFSEEYGDVIQITN